MYGKLKGLTRPFPGTDAREFGPEIHAGTVSGSTIVLCPNSVR